MRINPQAQDMGGLMMLNSTAHWVSCEPYSESTSLGLPAHTIWKWMRVWQIYYLLNLNKSLTKVTTRTREIQMGPNISLQRSLRDTIYLLKPDKKSYQHRNSEPDPYPFCQWPLKPFDRGKYKKLKAKEIVGGG